MSTLETLHTFTKHGKLVIFVGAGVSKAAPTSLPDWWTLNREVVEAVAARVESMTGKGISGLIKNQAVLLGNEQMMRDNGVDTNSLQDQVHSLRNAGQTVMFLAIEKQLLGIIGVADSIKSTTAEAISQLQKAGVHIAVLTGDNEITAKAVADQLKLSDVTADVLPQDKFQYIAKLQKQGHIVAMAGDGINDAPALAQANIGIAMGGGTDIAMHSAHIVLVKGDLRSIAKARIW